MTFHIYFYVWSELIKSLKAPSSPGSRGLYQGGSPGVRPWPSRVCWERQHSCLELWLCRLRHTVLGWILPSQTGNKKSAEYMHTRSVFQIKTVKSERSYSYLLPTKLWKTDVQNDLHFYVWLWFCSPYFIPVWLIWGKSVIIELF